MTQPIITSLLDTDAYKFTMGSAYWHLHRNVEGQFAYTCRSKDVDLKPIADQFREQVQALGDVSLTKGEAEWLYNNTKTTRDYIRNFLTDFQFNPDDLLIEDLDGGCGLKIETKPGLPIYEASLWEMPVMALLSELYFKNKYGTRVEEVEASLRKNLEAQTSSVLARHSNDPRVDFTFSEFGTRRRFSRDFQEWLLETLQRDLGKGYLVGTSNLMFAKELKVAPVGTMAHEWMMAYQALVHPIDSQRKALLDWIDFYRGWNGIVLTDTLGSAKWDQDFTPDLMEVYTGQRHDSGDPSRWAANRIEAYKEAGIDPKDKTLLFSDGLTLGSAFGLSKKFGDQIRVTHGIGTSLSNPTLRPIDDGFEHKAISQVMKLVSVNGRPVAKLSDDPAKAQCTSDSHLAYVKWATQFPSSL